MIFAGRINREEKEGAGHEEMVKRRIDDRTTPMVVGAKNLSPLMRDDDH